MDAAQAAQRTLNDALATAKQLKTKSREAKRRVKAAKKAAKRASKDARAARQAAQEARRQYKKAVARVTKARAKAAKAARKEEKIVTPKRRSPSRNHAPTRRADRAGTARAGKSGKLAKTPPTTAASRIRNGVVSGSARSYSARLNATWPECTRNLVSTSVARIASHNASSTAHSRRACSRVRRNPGISRNSARNPLKHVDGDGLGRVTHRRACWCVPLTTNTAASGELSGS
jgi:hypothetical protein